MIVISAAGFSTRFKKEGITTPKVLLPLRDGIVFDYVLASFKKYFDTEDFLIVTRDEDNLPEELERSLERAQVRNYEIVTVDAPQDGMFPNVLKALAKTRFSLEQRMLLHVADIFRPGFTLTKSNDKILTIDFGLKATNAPLTTNMIATISSCQGLGCYIMPSAKKFYEAYKNAQLPKIRTLFGEKVMEIAEGLRLTRQLRKSGNVIESRLVQPEDYINCGKPSEYRQLRATDLFKPF